MTVEINKKNYDICVGWANVRFTQYMSFLAVEIPKKLKAMQQAKTPDERHAIAKDITTAEDRLFAKYYASVVACFSNIPSDILYKNCKPHQVFALYRIIMEGMPNIENEEEFKDFETPVKIRGELYTFPSRFMRQEFFGEYVEAAQFELDAQNIGESLAAVPKMCLLVLKKQGQKYEGAADESNESFNDINMDTVWRVCFFLQAQKRSYDAAIHVFTQEKQIQH